MIDLVVVALAASRLTRLAVADSITESLRRRVWRRFPGDSTTWGDSEVRGRFVGRVEVMKVNGLWYAVRPHPLGRMLECAWCAGFWVGLAVLGSWWLYPEVMPVLAVFAVAEVVGLLNDR